MKKWIIITVVSVIVVAILGFIGWRAMAGNLEKPVRTVSATYQTVTKDIAFTSAVSAKQSSSLAFELTGSIQAIYAHVGDHVVKGQHLAQLNIESVQLELAKARADKAGSSSVNYVSWQKTAEDTKNTKAENAKILEQKRQAVRDAKIAWDQSKTVYNAKVEESDTDSSLALSAYSSVVANEAAYHAAQKALDTSLISVKKSNAAAQKTEDITYAQYLNVLQTNPTTPGLSSLGALEELARLKASKSVLRAPFSGVVTKQSADVGELATAGEDLFTVETVSDFELTSDVPETDALALSVGMSADATFDALPAQDAIATTISTIDPAAVIIQGVPTFKITLGLQHAPTTLRSGLTANVIVHVAKKERVLGIPRRAISTKNGEEFVKIQKADTTEEERKVTTGLAGSDGTIEITSGLSEGDVIVTP